MAKRHHNQAIKAGFDASDEKLCNSSTRYVDQSLAAMSTRQPCPHRRRRAKPVDKCQVACRKNTNKEIRVSGLNSLQYGTYAEKTGKIIIIRIAGGKPNTGLDAYYISVVPKPGGFAGVGTEPAVGFTTERNRGTVETRSDSHSKQSGCQ